MASTKEYAFRIKIFRHAEKAPPLYDVGLEQRDLNIVFVNEPAILFHRLELGTREVLERLPDHGFAFGLPGFRSEPT